MMIITSLSLIAASAITESSNWGLRRLETKLPNAVATVYMPRDLRQGEVISGTVVLEQTEASDEIKGVVVEINGQRVGPGPFTLRVPAAAFAISMSASGSHVTKQLTPTTAWAGKPATSWVAPVCQSGQPLEVSGPFDGNLSNTALTMNGQPMEVIAESPRVAIGLPQSTPAPGHAILTTQENGGPTTSLSTCVAKVEMSANKTTVLRGEQVTVSCVVSGLESLQLDAFPVTFEIENRTPTVVTGPAFRGKDVTFAIQATDLRAGVWQQSITVTGLRPGAFVLAGVMYYVPFHNLKMGLNEDELRALIDAQLESARAKKDKKVADKAPEGAINLMKKRIESLEGAKDALPDLDSSRTLLDKAMADASFFEMAGELIDFAAEMLGYKDLPLPGIGHVLKGLKIVAKGSEKAIKLIEKAEKALEKIEEIKDAKERAEKAAEAKALLEKLRKELDK